MTMTVGSNGGHSLSAIKFLTKGATVSAGAYASHFPINLYAASGHNEFIVCKIK